MKWTKASKYSQTSGEWRLCACKDREGFMYGLWRGSELIGYYDDPKAAKRAAAQKEMAA